KTVIASTGEHIEGPNIALAISDESRSESADRAINRSKIHDHCLLSAIGPIVKIECGVRTDIRYCQHGSAVLQGSEGSNIDGVDAALPIDRQWPADAVNRNDVIAGARV